MNEELTSCRELVLDEALAWFARMRGPSASACEADFAAWLDLGEDRRDAYAQVARMFENAAVLKQSPRYGAGSGKTEDTPRRYRLALAIVSVALVAGSVGWHQLAARSGGGELASASHVIATRKGEIRTFRLTDGSSITLDTASRVQVAKGDAKRHIRLLSGRARVTVEPGDRPFLVDAGSGQLSASTGTFDVASAPGYVTISPLKGQGKVRSLYQSAASALWSGPRSLGPGEVLRYGTHSFADAAFGPVTARERDRAWPTGWATYRAVRLDALVAEVNRYGPANVVLDGHALRHEQVSGRFRLNDSNGFARAIGDLLDLEVVRTGNEIHLRRR
jgi:transmembrane sensor